MEMIENTNSNSSDNVMKPAPSLSTSASMSASTSYGLEDNDIAMKALNVCHSDSVIECNRNKSVSSSASSNSSRKRKFEAMDDEGIDDEDYKTQKPPAKKQKSEPPNGLQNEDIDIGPSPFVFGAHSI